MSNQPKTPKKKKSFGIPKLFYNDRFVLIFSILAAIVLWFIMATVNTNERPRVIYDVPIEVTLPDSALEQGYKIYGQNEVKARVSVKGNSLTVNQIKNSDIQVVAQEVSSVSGAGEYTFNLVAVKKGQLTDYEVVSIDPGTVVVEVDKSKEMTLPIESKIKYTTDENHYISAPELSTSSVKLSGPETVLNKVAKAVVEYDVKESLQETKTFSTKINLYDSEGNLIEDDRITMSTDRVDVTLTVLSRKELPITFKYKNQPSNFDLDKSKIKITPETLDVGATADMLNNLSEVSLGELDLSKLSPDTNTFVMDIMLPDGVRNLSNVTTATVEFDLSDFATKTIDISNFNVKNLDASKNATVTTKSLSVTIVAPKSVIDQIEANDISADIDMSSINVTGSTEVPVTITVNSASGKAWAYGSYKVNINVRKT